MMYEVHWRDRIRGHHKNYVEADDKFEAYYLIYRFLRADETITAVYAVSPEHEEVKYGTL